jgi:lipoic acid synthetase
MSTSPVRPPWLKVRAPGGAGYQKVLESIRAGGLHTVCESARCPNMGECWGQGTATFMILGNVCTRSCGFCAVQTGRPTELDLDEPEKVARAVVQMGLSFAVVTSVNRDELADGGAAIFAETIRAIRRGSPHCGIEVLIPDFRGSPDALDAVLDAGPDVLNHNTETVPRLYRRVRPQARYVRSLRVLRRAAMRGARVKSGLMLGLGETHAELEAVFADLAEAGVRVLTLGQYLQPTPEHLPIDRYVPPEEFAALKERALALGFDHVEAGPLVRSSYHAHEAAGRP